MGVPLIDIYLLEFYSLMSIASWPQMRRKGVGLDQVYDARALRVVVGDAQGKLHVAAVEGCYNLLSVVHR